MRYFQVVGSLVLAFSCLVINPSTGAQNQPAQPVVSRRVGIDPAIDERIIVARRLLQIKDYTGASAYLENMLAEYESSSIIFNLLRTCYLSLGTWTKLEDLSRRYIATHPNDPKYYFFLADALLKQSKETESLEAYRHSLTLISKRKTIAVESVLNSMLLAGFYDALLDVIDSIRVATSDETAYTMQRGQVFEGRGDYERATREFFASLGQKSRGAMAQRRLHEMLKFPESAEQCEQTLVAMAKNRGNLGALKILSHHYLKKGDFELASQYAIRQDSAEGYKGATLMRFLRQCRDGRHYREAIEMGKYLRLHHEDKSYLVDATFIMAEALAALSRFPEALSLLDTVITIFPHPSIVADALYEKGSIYIYLMNMPDSGLVYLDSVITRFPQGRVYNDARMARPHAQLLQGRIETALASWTELTDQRLPEDQMEDIAYHRAQTQFFLNEFDSCRAGLKKLIVNYPRGMFINDALNLLMLFDEADEAPGVMTEFSRTILFEERRMLDSAAAGYVRIADAPSKVGADYALFRAVDLWLSQGDSAAAFTDIDRLIEEHAESYYFPFGLKLKADLLWQDDEKTEEVFIIYRRLLEEFGTYPFISDVRERLRMAENI